MNINAKSTAKAILILVFLTVLPLIGQQFIPSEFIKAFSMQGGVNVFDILNRIAVVGVILAILVAVRGHVDKASARWVTLSSVWKVFWLFMVFFLLGLGYPETFGLAALGGRSEAAENSVVFDFRLFAILVTVIVVLMIIRSILQFQETSLETAEQTLQSKLDTS